GLVRLDDHHLTAPFPQTTRGFCGEPPANHHSSDARPSRFRQLSRIVERSKNKNAGIVQTVHRWNLRARTGSQNQLVVTSPIAVAAADRPILPVDLLHSDAKSSPDAVLLVPLDVIQRDAFGVTLAGQHAGKQP